MIYGSDLAFIHDSAFGSFACEAAPGLIGRLRTDGITEGVVVDLACGSGILARELFAAGYSVVGVDLSVPMIALARELVPQGLFVQHSLHSVDIPRCGAVFSIGEGLSYLEPNQTRLDLKPLFQRVWNALNPGGLFVFDVVESCQASNHPMEYRTERADAGWRLATTVSENTETGILTREIAIVRHRQGIEHRVSELHQVQTFDQAELHDSLAQCGFEVQIVRQYGEFQLLPRRLGVVAHKSRHA
jgi:SAM-dependent methyltransferase